MVRSRLLAVGVSLLVLASVVGASVGTVPVRSDAAHDPAPGSGITTAAATTPVGPETNAVETAAQTASGGNVSRVAFDYAQFGGNINLEVNGDRVFNRTQLDAAPPDGIDGATIGGATVSVSSNGSSGTVVITGDIRSFSLGGQELYVDNVQFGPASTPNATVTFRSLTPAQSSYAVGDQFSSNGVDITVEEFIFSDGSTYQQGTGRQVNDTNAGGPRPEFYPGNVNLRFDVNELPPRDGEDDADDVITGFHRPQIDGQLFGHEGQSLPEGTAPEWADGYNATMTLVAAEGEDIQTQVFTKAVDGDLYAGLASPGVPEYNETTLRELRFRLDRDGNGELSDGDARLTAVPVGPDFSSPSYASLTAEVYRNGDWIPVDTDRQQGFGVAAIQSDGDGTGIEARIDTDALDDALGDEGEDDGQVNLDVEIETDSNSYDLGGDGLGYDLGGTDVGNGWVDQLPEPETTPVDLSFDHLEVTQAVQTRDNELPLVRDKTTLARAFVTHNLSRDLRVRVTFEATAIRPGGIQSLGTRTVTFEAPPGSPDREKLEDSANLELPSSWTDEPEVVIGAEVEPANALVVDKSQDFLDDGSLEVVDYQETYDPNVYIVRINEGPSNAPEKPAWSRVFAMSDEFEATFPVADPNFIYLTSAALGPQSGQEDINLLGELIKLKTAIANGNRYSSRPTPDVLVGATEDPRADGAIGLAAVAYPNGRSGTVASWANDPKSFVHEVDHNIGNNTWGRHVADSSQSYGCGADGPDQLWNQRFNDDSIHALGWEDDVGLKRPTRFGRTVYHDFMSYCGPAWVSDYRWKMLLERFQNFTPGQTIHPDLQSGSGGSSSSAGSDRTMRLVSGRIFKNGTATLDPSFEMPGNATGQTPVELADPQAIAVVEYADSTVERPVRVNFERAAHGENSDPESLPFAIAVPERTGIESVRLLDAETREPLAVRQATGFEIETTEFSIPSRFERNATTEVGVELATTTDRRLYKRVLYVPEGEGLEAPLSTERYKLPMGTAFTGDSFNASFERLPGTDAGRFVVLVSDGVQTRAVVSPAFEVPPGAPQVRIEGSRSYNATYDREAGSPGNRPLEGIERVDGEIRTTAGAIFAVDVSAENRFGESLVGAETGTGQPAVQWQLVDSEGDVVATDTGRRFVGSSGAIGEYVLRVTATDPSTGATATDSIPVIVEAPPLPGRDELRTFREAIASVSDGEPSGPTLRLSPATQNATVGTNVTYELVFDPATDGVGSYDLNVTVANGSIARIVAANQTIGASVSSVSLVSGGDRARFRVAGGTGGTGTVRLGTITVLARQTGTTRLSVSEATVGDRNNSEYTIGAIENASITGQTDPPGPECPDLSGNGDPARDLDGDGRCEDITGDGEFDIIDISVFLEVFDTEAVRNDPTPFDFNDDGVVSIVDVATLLGEL